MNIFTLYLKLGIEHILDLNGYDHILFLTALCGVYLLNDWKKILILVTAFTVGHSLSLASAVTGIVVVDSDIIEFLIPITIFVTSAYNIVNTRVSLTKRARLIKYIMALFFGLIHGLGFSNYLKSLLGTAEDIVLPLFAFNIGIETGQIAIVSIILTLASSAIRFINIQHREWNLVLSGASLGISFILMMERIPM